MTIMGAWDNFVIVPQSLIMKNVKCQKKHKSIRNSQSKFYCKFSGNEHVLFDEVIIRLKYHLKQDKNLNKRGWGRVFSPSFLVKRITEIIKAMF